jgi:5-formyltetrahydrofolate cyclo-ligase
MSGASHRLKQAKRAIRREVLAARDALADDDRAAMSAAIADRLLGLPEAADAATVMVFWSFGSEVDTSPLIDRLLADGRTVALPRIEGADVVPVAYQRGDPMVATTFGAMEPSDGRTLRSDELDLIVVPGVAFDREGNRVGYGGGFYDRLLSRLRPGVPSVGIAFGLQVVDRVPSGGTDRRVHAIVTEAEVLRPGLRDDPGSGQS